MTVALLIRLHFLNVMLLAKLARLLMLPPMMTSSHPLPLGIHSLNFKLLCRLVKPHSRPVKQSWSIGKLLQHNRIYFYGGRPLPLHLPVPHHQLQAQTVLDNHIAVTPRMGRAHTSLILAVWSLTPTGFSPPCSSSALHYNVTT